MIKKNFFKIFFLFFLIIFIIIIFKYKFYKKNEDIVIVPEKKEELVYSSNIIKDVRYITKDADGNEYIVSAKEGEIDFANSNIIFLTDVKAFITLKNSDKINIISNYGKYNSDNFDTIFSKNVMINYLDNKILGEYLDFSLERNSMIISREVIYSNKDNVLKADVIDINLKTKDTKIFMYENKKKINIKSKN